MKISRGSGLVLGVLGLLTGFPLAAPRSIADCEKIQATDAYNQCLASFGPVAHLRPMKPLAAGGNGGAGRHDGHIHYHYRHGHHAVSGGHRHGRHFMVIGTGHSHGHHRHRH